MEKYTKNRLCYFIFKDNQTIIVDNRVAKSYIFDSNVVLDTILKSVEGGDIFKIDILKMFSRNQISNPNVEDILTQLVKMGILLVRFEEVEEEGFISQYQARYWTELQYLNQYTLSPISLLHELHKKKVVVIGAGALGSSLVLKLSAIGIQNIICIDGDIVELDNLTRQVLYTPADVLDKRKKVDALGDRIYSFYPETKYSGRSVFLNTLMDCKKLIPNDADLIIQTADSPIGKIDDWVNTVALEKNIPVIFSHFGSVGPLVIPRKTGCLKCLEDFLNKRSLGLYSLITEEVHNIPNSKSPSFVTGVLLNELIILELIKSQWIFQDYQKNKNKIFTFYGGFQEIVEFTFPMNKECQCAK